MNLSIGYECSECGHEYAFQVEADTCCFTLKRRYAMPPGPSAKRLICGECRTSYAETDEQDAAECCTPEDLWGERATAAYIATLENLVDRAAELLNDGTLDLGANPGPEGRVPLLKSFDVCEIEQWFKDFNECRSGREALAWGDERIIML